MYYLLAGINYWHVQTYGYWDVYGCLKRPIITQARIAVELEGGYLSMNRNINHNQYIQANNIWLQQRFHNVGESCENVGKIKLLQHIPGKFKKSCHNVAANSCRKTSPQHYGNIHSFRQSVTIFTMLWQPFCNMGKSA